MADVSCFVFLNRLKLASAFFFLFFYKNAFGQDTKFTLQVINERTKQPIEYAAITYHKQYKVTDANGQADFIYNVKNVDTIFVSIIGYYSSKIPIINYQTLFQIQLTEYSLNIADVTISGFNKETVFNYVKDAIQLSKTKIKPFAADITTISTDTSNIEQLEIIEVVSGSYNINIKNGSYDNPILVNGTLVLKKENLFQNYMSVGNTKLLIQSNILNNYSPFFYNPFIFGYKTQKDFIKIDYKIYNDSILIIQFKHNKVDGQILYNIRSKYIESCRYIWTYNQNLPIEPLQTNSVLGDKMQIESLQNFRDGKLLTHYLKLIYNYNDKPIKTYSHLTRIADTLLFNSIGIPEFNNDYIDILALPTLMPKYEMDADILGKVRDEILQQNIQIEELILTNKIAKSEIENITRLGYYNNDFLLNWALIPDCKVENFDTKIAIQIAVIKDGYTYLTIPFLDYENTIYCYDRSERGATYIILCMIIGLKYSKKLSDGLSPNSTAKEIYRLHKIITKEMNKELWKLKFETNGGTYEGNLEKWKMKLESYLPNIEIKE